MNRIVVEDDIAYSTRRATLRYILKDHDRRSPLVYVDQTIVRETGTNYLTAFTAYDILNLTGTSFYVDDKVFLIIDNEAYPMKLENKELDYIRTVSEETEDIAVSDSTSVTVTTGYSFNNSKVTRFSYSLPEEVVTKIINAEKILFRYYSGPSMMTVPLKQRNLDKLKMLVGD